MPTTRGSLLRSAICPSLLLYLQSPLSHILSTPVSLSLLFAGTSPPSELSCASSVSPSLLGRPICYHGWHPAPLWWIYSLAKPWYATLSSFNLAVSASSSLQFRSGKTTTTSRSQQSVWKQSKQSSWQSGHPSPSCPFVQRCSFRRLEAIRRE